MPNHPTDDALTDLVRDWPYAREFVLDTMDPDLIQRHGELLLSRSINIGRIVAFVGAGVSMSYGRISWRELVRELLRTADRRYRKKNKDDPAFRSNYPRIEAIYNTLTALKPTENAEEDGAWRDMPPARLLILFQIADELGEAIHRTEKTRTNELNSVRRDARQLVYDDAGHARRLFEAAYENSDDDQEPLQWFKKYLDQRPLTRNLLRSQPPYQSIFSRATLEKILADIPFEDLRILCGIFQKHREQDPKAIYLNPTHRFVVSAALASMESSKRAGHLTVVAQKYLSEKQEGSLNQIIEENEPPRFRDETVDPNRDPLQLLVNRLGIRRFITTNYDLDIEQMMLDRGYRLRLPGRGEDASNSNFIAESVNAIEARARDFVFREDRAAHLIDFAVQDGRFALDAVHLHGRATDGEDLVATEADYQRLYLRDESGRGRGRELLDGAINLAFRGNALLFVGNGMGEDDLLRPLRHFMSEGPSGRESDAIALLPDLKGEQARLEEKATLLRRYGVYTIHFGIGQLEKGPEEFLLSALVTLIRFLVKQIALLGDDSKPSAGVSDAEKLQEDIEKELLKAERSIEEAAKTPPGKPATSLATRLIVRSDGILRLARVTAIERQPPTLINCELETINYLLGYCVRAAEQKQRGDFHKAEHRAARILAQNTEDAIVAGFLAAVITRLRSSWAEWREQWFGDLSPRQPRPRPVPWTGEQGNSILSGQAMIDRRRSISLLLDRDSRGEIAEDGRFRIKRSQTLAHARAALLRHALEPKHHEVLFAPGRRVFLLAGPRGIGKGHFFSALTDSEGLQKFLEASWPLHDLPKYVGAFAFNFSFSVELGSGFDRLALFLRERIESGYGEDRDLIDHFTRRYEEFAGRPNDKVPNKPMIPHSGDRIGILDFLFRVIAGKIAPELPKPQGRFVLLFNAMHLLFSTQGYTKSSDVTRIMNILLNPGYSDAAIDIVFVTDEKGIPLEFRDRGLSALPDTQFPHPQELAPFPWAVQIIHSLEDRLRSIAEDSAAATRLRLRLPVVSSKPATAENAESGPAAAEDADAGSAPAKAGEQAVSVALFLRLRPSMLGVVAAAAFPKTVAAMVLDARPKGLKTGRAANPSLDDLAARVEEIITEQIEIEGSEGIIARTNYVDALADLGRDKRDISDKGLRRDFLSIDQAFGAYFRAFGGSRFALTIAFAAADEELLVNRDTRAGLNTLEAIRNEVSGIDDPSREDSIVRAVIAFHRRRGVRRAPFENILGEVINTSVPAEKLTVEQQRAQTRTLRRLSEICEELLVALSMIGSPIERDCLTALRFEALDEKTLPADRKHMVGAALDIMVRRCLVFRFEPTIAQKPADRGMERYGVHRHVQRHIFRQLKQPFVEHAEIESYMPTLYASQPNDLPYPTVTGQDRIREIVALLSRYPSHTRLRGRDVRISEGASVQSRMLRAAYGAIRTVYGVGVVARFHEFGDKSKPPAVGYFEEHRQQVRWLLRRAKDVERLLERDSRKSLRDYIKSLRAEKFGSLVDRSEKKLPPVELKKVRDRKRFLDDKFAQDLPFYSGDIAWLYNECGVLSLVQGRLNDASKLFSEALKALNPLERRGTPSALTASVRLNRALADIELGNLRKADAALRDIIAQQDEHRAVRWIAVGYRGLIEHIRGNLKEAGIRYQGALEVLTKMGRNRAASIFSRHSADLNRRLGGDNLKEAERLADNAVTLATAGSHADVLHQARLSRLLVRAARKGRDSFAELSKELEGIDVYAKVMGMPRLEVETTYVDAHFRHQLGDLNMAMKAITRSLAIANDCDLVLRKIGGALLAAKISRELGMLEGARTLAETAKVMATTAEFSGDQDTAQTILASL